MQALLKKKVVVFILIFAVLSVGLFAFINLNKQSPKPSIDSTNSQPKNLKLKHKAIGQSVEGRKIEAHTYGSGDKHLLFVGGIHGGYEWNSVLLAYQLMDYLDKNPNVFASNLTVTIIPSANPDGVYKVIGKEGRFNLRDVTTDKETLISGRFNANGVDLNRNFDCKWKPKSMWQGSEVSAGSAPFSEPEARAIKSFVLENKPRAVIFWHSQANAVYASECKAGILPETLNIMNTYSKASGYPGVKSFDSYDITGDAEGWLASINIPAITVELKTHQIIEWERNLEGIKALFKYYEENS